jgi:hypothetical protein
MGPTASQDREPRLGLGMTPAAPHLPFAILFGIGSVEWITVLREDDATRRTSFWV